MISSYGHIMDLDRKKMGIEIDTWTPKYVISPDKRDVVKGIKAEAKNHKDIYIATDDDNEGHAIAFNLKEILPKRGKVIYRTIFKTITKKDVLAGIKNPTGFDEAAYTSP